MSSLSQFGNGNSAHYSSTHSKISFTPLKSHLRTFPIQFTFLISHSANHHLKLAVWETELAK